MAKHCTTCQEEKPLHMFYKHKQCRDGRQPECKQCTKQRMNAAYQKNPGKKQAAAMCYYNRQNGTKEGYVRLKYSRIKSRCTNPNQPSAQYYYGLGYPTKDEFIARMLGDPTFNALWDQWVTKGRPRKLAPSVDRIDPGRGYELDNIQFLTVSDNVKRRNKLITLGG